MGAARLTRRQVPDGRGADVLADGSGAVVPVGNGDGGIRQVGPVQVGLAELGGGAVGRVGAAEVGGGGEEAPGLGGMVWASAGASDVGVEVRDGVGGLCRGELGGMPVMSGQAGRLVLLSYSDTRRTW